MLIGRVFCVTLVACLFVISSLPLNGAPALQKKPNPEVDVRSEDGSVFVAADQIRSYDWATHTLTLASKVHEELTGRLRKSKPGALVSGIPFTVCVGGKPVYTGKFTMTLSSRTIFDSPVVVVDLATLDPTLGPDRLRIQLGYPGVAPFKMDDPRDDERIRDALKATGKLAADPGWIRVIPVGKEGESLLFRPDGTGRTEMKAPPTGRSSPDGKRIVSVSSTGDETAVRIADIDGKNSRKLTSNKVFANSMPTWSPDGKRIALVASGGGQGQVFVMDQDGGNLRQVTDAGFGAEFPTFSPDGRLTYLVWGERPGRDRRADLVIGEGKDAKTLLKGMALSAYAWSPDGKSIVYGKPGSLVFHEVVTGKEQAVAFEDIDRRLKGHAAFQISWCPDSQAVACSLTFLGSRLLPNSGAKPFGVEEVFVIPRVGKPTWFSSGEWALKIDWLRDKPREKR